MKAALGVRFVFFVVLGMWFICPVHGRNAIMNFLALNAPAPQQPSPAHFFLLPCPVLVFMLLLGIVNEEHLIR
jgi:hypothetical protein